MKLHMTIALSVIIDPENKNAHVKKAGKKMNSSYKVMLTGKIIPGWEYDEVLNNLASILKKSPEDAAKFISGTPVVIKKNISHDNALKIINLFENAGCDCEIAEEENFLSDLEIDIKKEQHKESGRICPKCGHSQKDGIECLSCGVIFSKLYGNDKEEKQQDENIDKKTEENEGEKNSLISFIGQNQEFYLKQFKKFDENNGKFKFSWNWPCFFFQGFWMIFRKMYLLGTINLISLLAVDILNSYLAAFSYIAFAVSANFIYYKHINSKIEKLEKSDSKKDIDLILFDQGGTSFKHAVISVVAISILMVSISQIGFVKRYTMKKKMEKYYSIIEVLGKHNLERMDTNSVLRPKFYTKEGMMEAGTAFIANIPAYNKKALVVPHHLFSKYGGFSKYYYWDELKKLVRKVSAKPMKDSFLTVETSNILLVQGADSFDKYGAKFDIAAFLLDDNTELPALNFYPALPGAGEPVWMLGEVSNREESPQFFKANIIYADEKSISYIFEDKDLDMQATSGTPILNAKGDVVAMNVSFGFDEDKNLIGEGNPSISMGNMLVQALRY